MTQPHASICRRRGRCCSRCCSWCGVKGAAILFGTTILLYGVWRNTSSIKILLLCGTALAVVCVGYGVWSGERAGDYHVIGFVVVIAAFVTLLRSSPFGMKWRRPRTTGILFIGFGIGLVSGVFQEEAYSPHAIGFLALFCGVLVANGQRSSALLDANAP